MKKDHFPCVDATFFCRDNLELLLYAVQIAFKFLNILTVNVDDRSYADKHGDSGIVEKIFILRGLG